MKKKAGLPTQKEIISLRKKILEMSFNGGGGHIGGAFSIAEIVSVLYKNILNINPKNPHYKNRDRLIFSKGHACLALYPILADLGFFPKKELELYGKPGGILPGHTTITVPGVEASTGSLGHGLPIGVGMALAAKLDKANWKVYVIMGDGDSEEGSSWEAIMSAGHHGLDNLTAIVDFNNLSSFEKATDTFKNLIPLADKFLSFGWAVEEIDGHNVSEIYKTLKKIPFNKGKPSVIIANTTKGKSVSFMEDNPTWHYKMPSAEEYQKAIMELEK